MDRETADEISRRFNVVGEELRTEIRTVRRHFDVVGEELRSQIRIVAEGLQGLREVTTAEFKSVRDEISETQSMIRLSFPISIDAFAHNQASACEANTHGPLRAAGSPRRINRSGNPPLDSIGPVSI